MNLNDKMIAEFRALVYDYNLMDLYYKGDHDINRLYNKFPNRSNQIVIDNFINTAWERANLTSRVRTRNRV